ncbi:MAG: nickel-dependent lactate racemase [Chloroflexi bacterium]|nr:nickel-dependent lactate racemase [Chloroflexota bacterium]
MTTSISLPYGKEHISFTLPEDNFVSVLWPSAVETCSDPHQEIEQALDHPLGTKRIEQIVSAGEKVLILVDDYTRGTPVPLILPHLLKRIQSRQVRDEDITLLVSTGTHRPCSESELLEKFGEDIFRRYRIEQHDCSNIKNQIFLGLTSRGTPVWVNRLLVENDRIFGIGHIDPSDFAGYAGGWKLIVPGVAALETIDANHTLATLSFRHYGNIDLPCRQDINEAGEMVRVDQFINVVLCQDDKIARAFAGSPTEIHLAGVSFAKKVYEVECPSLVDIAIVSAYPYDIDFYQSIRAIEYADVIVRPGGSILVVAPCQDGIGSEDFYRLLTASDRQPDDFLRNIARRNGKVTYNVLGYFLTLIRAEKQIYGFMPGINGSELEALGIHSINSLQSGVDAMLQAHGPKARLAVFPVGSATIPHLAK